MRSIDHLGIGGIGIVFVIFILFSSATFANAAPPTETPPQNSQQKIDEILDELMEIKGEIVIMREDIKKLTESGTRDFEFELDSSDSDMGAVAFTLFGRCMLEESQECDFFSVTKIVPTPLSNAIFFGLCVDHFNCNLLQDQTYKIGFDVEGGFSLAAHGAGGAGADVNGPIYPILPVNILTVSGVGDTSASRVVTIMDISVTPQAIQNGLLGELTFVGERPVGMEMFGWYLDSDGFHCFAQDSETGEVNPVSEEECDALQIEALPSPDFEPECFEIKTFPSINFGDIQSILSKESIQDIALPLETLRLEICTDGTYVDVADDFFDNFPLFLNPVGSEDTAGDFCKLIGEEMICGELNLEAASSTPIIDPETIMDIEYFVDDINQTVSGISNGFNASEELLRCVTNQDFAESHNGQSKCQIMNYINSVYSNVIDIFDFLEDL